MILTITLNPCIDKSTIVPQLIPENKLRCTEIVWEAGGGGINVSKALQKLEVESIALFPSGGHNGNLLCSLLRETGIKFHVVDSKVESRENWVVWESSTNHQFRFTFPGRPVESDALRPLIDQISSLRPQYIVASGSLPPGLPDTFYQSIVRTAHQTAARCIIDTSGSALQALRGEKPFLIKPNRNELAQLVHRDQLSEEEITPAARQVIQDGYAELVVVSLGASGAWLVSKDQQFYCKAPAVEKKSTVGAGDSMVAGITFMLAQEHGLAEALQFGVACGSAATMNPGTQLFDPKQAFRLYEQIRNSP
jgi:6-phosphofructokinase 2